MTLFDRLSDRVGDFFEDVLLPDEIHALHQQAHRAMAADDYDQALQFLGEAEHRRPQTERTRRLRGICHFHLGHLDKARELLTEALELREEGATHFYLGLTQEQQGQYDDALAHFRRALTLDKQPSYGQELYFALGRTYLAKGRPDKATRELRRAQRLGPQADALSAHLAEALRQQGQLAQAAELIRPLAQNSDDLQTLFTLGRIEASLDQPEAAAQAFDRVLKKAPDHRPALLAGARAHLALGKPLRANELLLRALSGGTDDAEVYTLLGQVNEGIDNTKKARQSFEAALTRDADHLGARLGAGRMALAADEFEQGAHHFEYALRLMGEPGRVLPAHDSPPAHQKSAHQQGDHRQPDHGQQNHGQQALPDRRTRALLGLGRCRLAMGDPAGARRLLEEASQLHQSRPPELLHALGQVALAAGDPAEALVPLRQALNGVDGTDDDAISADIDRALAALNPDWKHPGSFANTAALTRSLQDLTTALAADPLLEPFVARAQALLTALERPLSVAIVGEFNAGKSTLVNALLGEEVVPMGVLPTTAHPCVMTYGPRKGARIAFSDGRLQDVDFATAREKMSAQADEIERLHFTYPHPGLRSIEYWDTPGFNALDDRHEALADQALGEAEAIIWLLDSNQALKESEFARLDNINDAQRRVILVVNKIDRLGPADDRGDAIDEILAYLDTHAGDRAVDILAISALEALRAQTTEDAERPADFERLLAILDEHFVQRSWEIKISETARGLDQLLADIEAFRQTEIDRYVDLQKTARFLADRVDERRQHFEVQARQHLSTLSDQREFVALGVTREIEEALKRQGQIFRRVVIEEEDRQFILELMRHRLEDVLARSRRELLAEITALESDFSQHLSALASSLSVNNARALRRRIEGFFDEIRVLKELLDKGVYDHYQMRTEGQLSSGATSTFDAIVDLGLDAETEARQSLILALMPTIDQHFVDDLQAWHREFFLVADRFCDRLCNDLSTLELEARHRLHFSTPATPDQPE